MKTNSLRDWLDYMRQKNYLITVKRKVNPKYELAAVVKKLEKQNIR